MYSVSPEKNFFSCLPFLFSYNLRFLPLNLFDHFFLLCHVMKAEKTGRKKERKLPVLPTHNKRKQGARKKEKYQLNKIWASFSEFLSGRSGALGYSSIAIWAWEAIIFSATVKMSTTSCGRPRRKCLSLQGLLLFITWHYFHFCKQSISR